MEAEISDQFDVIIVGAGSAGCVLANRLSADPRLNILLLEAGGKDNWVWFHIPVGYLFAIGNPRSDWMFRTVKEKGLNGRALNYPRGRTLGGSSAINAMISMRGQSQDYDDWRDMGLPGWGWDDVLPHFLSIEDHFLGNTDHHRAGGEWRVEEPRIHWDILDRIADAAEEMGIPRTPDFNTGDNTGVGYFHVNQKKGRRWSAARGFLNPVKHRPNLHIETHVEIDRLIMSGGRVTGVEGRQRGQKANWHARGAVVLSAGSVGSVQILQRSGIGPADTLKAHGIEPRLNVPGVGANLQDHLQQRAIYRVSNTKTLNETYHNLFKRGLMGLEYAFFRRGPLTMAPSQMGIFTKSDPAQSRANIEFHLQPLSLDKFGDPLHKFPAVTVSACNLRPSSRGHIHIGGPGLDDAPVIAPNYLSTEDDRRIAADAIRVTRRLMAQSALTPFTPEEVLPGPSVSDNQADLEKAAGDIGTTIFHPVSTCRMGGPSDPEAPLDHRMKFKNLTGLYVIDASAMPRITSGNTNTPTIMMADKGAGFVLEDLRN